MSFPALENYLARLGEPPRTGARIWRDGQGRAQGRYFNSTLTSAFQSVRELNSDTITGFEGFARSYSNDGDGLSLWRLLDHAASDDESIELDRLCRILHAVNFFRQAAAEGKDLYLSVHSRLLAAVGSNHGSAFKHILDVLQLPRESIVLQLPEVTENQGWLLSHVADNYRGNGFRIALNAAHAQEVLGVLERVRPDAVKLDAHRIGDENDAIRLIGECARRNIRVIFKRVESQDALKTLRRIGERSGQAIHVQGYLWGMPKSELDPAANYVRAA